MNTFADINKYKNEMLSEQQSFARQEAQLYADTQAYAKEGTLPITTVPDSRTITEKLADMEYIKKTLVGELSQIADPQFALRIVEGILKSPLNVDGRLMRFAGNNIVEFVAQLKKRYGIGIRGDLNDVTRMVDFLNTLYLETSKTNQSVSDYIKSTTNSTVQNTMSKSNVSVILDELKSILANVAGESRYIRHRLRNLINVFTKIRDYMPTEGQIQIIINLANKGVALTDAEREQIVRVNDFLSMLKKLPKPSIIMNLLETFKTYHANYNIDGMEDTLQRIDNYVREFSDSDEFKDLDRLLDIRLIQEREAFIQQQEQRRKQENEQARIQKVAVTNMNDFAQLLGQPAQPPPPPAQEPQLPIYGNGIIKRPRGRPRGTSMKYRALGTNEYNEDKFNTGILAIRKSSNKKAIPYLPSKIMTSNLKGIIKTISGGGLPTHNEIAKLDDEEKEYLSRIVKSSKIDRLDIPTPSKDKLEKLYHDFEVMKGQILAGNDNKKMVKEFKILVRKLSQMKMLPKADADDVIDLLLTLGY